MSFFPGVDVDRVTERAAPARGGLVKRPLGRILLDGDFVSNYDLDRALEEQSRTNERLGEVLVRLGVADPLDIRAALSVQGELASVKDAIRAAAGVRTLLGELLLETRRISPAQLDLALQEQRKTGEKLGEVLVRQGKIPKSELDVVLQFQKNQAAEASSPRFRLGEILVATGHITRAQLDRAVGRQKGTGKKIGELLVEAGDIMPQQVAHGLRIQKKLVAAALLAALSMAGAARAQEPPTVGSASARVTVTATVRANAALRVLHQSPELVITNADIARGYVEVRGASRIEVRNNSPAGYLLVFEGAGGPGDPFTGITIRGLGPEIQIDSRGGWVPRPYARGPVIVELDYRFGLQKDAQPGTYAWPLSLATQPL